MTDYMKEAERLLDEYQLQVSAVAESRDAKAWLEHRTATHLALQARSALLAHIQRGAVPDGNERDEWEAVVFTLIGHAASLYFRGQSDMPNWFYELAEKLARRHVDEALAARVREVGIQQRAALSAAPDQFRDAAKMMAEPADPDPLHLSRILHELAGAASLCWEPRPKGVFDSQLAIQFVEQALAEIRSRMMPAPAEVPMPEPIGFIDSNDEETWATLTQNAHELATLKLRSTVFHVSQMHTYGAACRAAGEAAGYAQGRKEAGRDAERYRWLCDVATEQQWVELGGYTVKKIIDAMRGEVK